MQQEREAAASGGEAAVVANHDGRAKQRRSATKSKGKKEKKRSSEEDLEEEEDGWGSGSDGSEGSERSVVERQREHPFIVTEPGEVARAKKNGLDYLFHLYEQCRHFLLQVQALAKERGDKCPTKVRTPSNALPCLPRTPFLLHHVMGPTCFPCILFLVSSPAKGFGLYLSRERMIRLFFRDIYRWIV